MPRTVMFFLPALTAGGAETHAIRVANHLDRSKWTPVFVLARAGGALEERVADDIEIVHLAGSEYGSSTISMARSLPALTALLRRRPPHVLCTFMEMASVAGVLAARAAGGKVPVVTILQNTLSRTLSPADSPRAWATLMRPLLRFTLPASRRVVALSEGVARDAEAVFPALAGNVLVIPNAGYDDDVVRNAQLDDMPSRPAGTLFLAVGRLAEQKGYPDLLRAFAALDVPGGAHLWIAGGGPLREELGALVDTLGIGDRVTFLGVLSNPYSCMAAADVFVLSSLYEGFGNVIVEAMACGTPVISTRCPHGPAEIIEDEVSGVLVPVADPAAMTAAMQRLAADPDLRASLADGGRRRALHYHAAQAGRQYTAMLDSLFPKPGRVTA